MSDQYCRECREENRLGAHAPWCHREPARSPEFVARHRQGEDLVTLFHWWESRWAGEQERGEG